MRKVSVRGVLVGGVTDIVATNILAIPLTIYVIAKFDLAHAPKGSVAASVTAAIHANPSLYAMELLIGLGCSVLGGYVAARLAKHDELLNGTLSSLLCVAIGVYSLAAGKVSGSPLEQLLLLIASPIFGLLGGYLRHMQKRSGAQQA